MTLEQMKEEYIKADNGTLHEDISYVQEEFGFATYNTVEDRQYLLNIYIVPEMRKKPVGDEGPYVLLLKRLLEKGKELGMRYSMAGVEHSNPAKNSAIKNLMHLGFRLSHNEDDMIVLYKEL